jgi:hypothetical protein
MKRSILSIVLALTILGLKAQITILNADMPKANDTLRFSSAPAGNFNFATTGLNTTWDFSRLVPTSQDVEKYASPLTSSYVIYFATATYGVQENNLSLGAFTGGAGLSNVMGFYKNTATASVLLGRGVSFNSLPLGLTLAPKDTIYKFPLTVGRRDSCSFAGSLSLATLGGFTQSGYRITTVDGWGKITTPYGLFDCIRVKSVIKEVDSISISGFSIPIPNNRTEYKWLAKGEKFPILEVVVTTGGLGVGGTTTVRFKDRYRPELFVNNANFTTSKVNATTTDTVNLNDACAGSPIAYQWTITPNTVSYVAGTSSTSQNPRVLFNAAGKYSIKLQATYQGGSDDTTRTNYITITGGNSAVKEIKYSPLEIIVFPVPASNGLNVQFSKPVKGVSIHVYDILGKEKDVNTEWSKAGSLASLDISGMPNGVYFVRMNVEGKDITKKFIKE